VEDQQGPISTTKDTDSHEPQRERIFCEGGRRGGGAVDDGRKGNTIDVYNE